MDAIAPQVDGKFRSAFIRARKPQAAASDGLAEHVQPLQRSLSLHGQLGALHHGRGHLELQGSPGVYGVQRGQPSGGRGSSGGAAADGTGPPADRGTAQQELGRVRATRRAANELRFHGMRQRRQRSVPHLAGSANDRALGHSRSCGGQRCTRTKSSAPIAMPS